MSAVRFSVVIPTRERADTLRLALRTCLDQKFDDYEVIVSDNHSSPATRAVVDEIASPKVRYVRTPEPMAMSANWEFAVSHARGEYVTVLGDDDALLPHALGWLDQMARSHPGKVIQWALAFYTWPSFGVAGHENYLRLPFGDALVERDGTQAIELVAGALERYEELPMVYNSIVPRAVLDDLRARVGKVFPHHIPDVYSGFAIAHVVGSFLGTRMPMSIRGASKASYGIAALFDPGKTQIEREFRALNEKGGFRSEPTIPALPVLPACIADPFLFTKHLFPDLKVALDRRELARVCLARTRAAEADWPEVLAIVRRSLADAPELVAWFDAELAGTPFTPPQPVTYFRPVQLGYDGASLHLDAADFGVTDVSGAARLCELLLHYTGRAPITRIDDVVAVVRKITELTAAFDEERTNILRRVLGWGQLIDRNRDLVTERESLIAERAQLLAVCAEREAIIHRVGAQLCAVDAQLQVERRWSLKRPLRKIKSILSGLTRKLAAVRR